MFLVSFCSAEGSSPPNPCMGGRWFTYFYIVLFVLRHSYYLHKYLPISWYIWQSPIIILAGISHVRIPFIQWISLIIYVERDSNRNYRQKQKICLKLFLEILKLLILYTYIFFIYSKAYRITYFEPHDVW